MSAERLYQMLSEHLTERKRELFETVLNQRTRYFTAVLEDIYQAQNTSAIIRSAEAWGMQDLHVVENRFSFSHHRRIARGANDWLTMHRYNDDRNNSEACFKALKEKGYSVVVTALHHDAVPMEEIDLTKKVAIVMGTELTGASETAIAMADQKIIVPMYGFTESLNVSVASGVIMQYISSEIRKRGCSWGLSEQEKLALKIEWARKTIYWSDHIVEMYEQGEIK